MRYATSGDLRIAYQTFGAGDLELVFVPGFISNLDMIWETRTFAPVLERLGAFRPLRDVRQARDRAVRPRVGFGSLEERMDDIRAVVDAVGFEQPAIVGVSEGGPLSLLVRGDVSGPRPLPGDLRNAGPRAVAPDYPEGVPRAVVDPLLEGDRGTVGKAHALGAFVQHMPDTAENREFVARYSRGACSPRMARQVLTRNIEIDVRGPACR